MRIGKLYKLHKPTKIFNTNFSQEPGKTLPSGTIFMILCVSPEQNLVNWYDIHLPWKVLVNNRIGLIETNHIPMEDLTPL